MDVIILYSLSDGDEDGIKVWYMLGLDMGMRMIFSTEMGMG